MSQSTTSQREATVGENPTVDITGSGKVATPAAVAAIETVRALPAAVLDDPGLARYAAAPCPGTDATPGEIEAWERIKRTILTAPDPRAAAAHAACLFEHARNTTVKGDAR